MITDNAACPYMTVRQFSETYNWPIGGIRHLLFYNPSHFRDRCVRQLGRKILLNVNAVWEWLEEQRADGYDFEGQEI